MTPRPTPRAASRWPGCRTGSTARSRSSPATRALMPPGRPGIRPSRRRVAPGADLAARRSASRERGRAGRALSGVVDFGEMCGRRGSMGGSHWSCPTTASTTSPRAGAPAVTSTCWTTDPDQREAGGPREYPLTGRPRAGDRPVRAAAQGSFHQIDGSFCGRQAAPLIPVGPQCGVNRVRRRLLG